MDNPVVLGVDFGGSKVAVAAADGAGARLGSATIAVRPDDSAQRTFDRGIAAAHDLLADVATGRTLVAVGACTFGIPRMDGIDLAPNIAGWDRLAFGDRLRLAFPGADIRMATDVKAAARAEAEHGALAGYDPGLYVNLGTGLAVAIVSHGEVLTGRHGAAGEIAYNLRDRGDDFDAPRLEEAVSGKALAAAAAELLDGGDVAALFEQGESDPQAARICAEFLAELALPPGEPDDRDRSGPGRRRRRDGPVVEPATPDPRGCARRSRAVPARARSRRVPVRRAAHRRARPRHLRVPAIPYRPSDRP